MIGVARRPNARLQGAAVLLVAALAAMSAGFLPAPTSVPALAETALRPSEMRLPLKSLTVITASGEALPFRVEIVATPEARAQGLMFRRSLPRDEGMLFVYPDAQRASFWMRNTLIPLDILFADAGGRIVNIAEAQPLDETPLPSDGPVQFVLEIQGGLSKELGIAPGDRLVSPAMLAAVRSAR